MKSIVLLLVLTLACFVQSKDMIVGTSFNNRLLSSQKAEYNAIPLKKRVKDVFFSDPGQQVLKGIIARDLDQSDASAIITSGGVGFSYANIKLKSERGSGLNYQIEYYV